jgi:hypothetical protein
LGGLVDPKRLDGLAEYNVRHVKSRSGIPAGLSAWALAEALPGALPKMSSSPAAGDEQGEGVAVLGGGDVEGER